MRPLAFHIFLIALCAATLGLPAEARSEDRHRGIAVTPKAVGEVGPARRDYGALYSASHALVIGIDDYENGWPRLHNAVRDARLVAEELRSQGFEVVLKTNLRSGELQRTLADFFVLKGEDPEARLFVWFAGHGHTAGGESYLIPADGPRPDAGARFRLKALSIRRFGEYMRAAQAKHAFAVFDSCFAGTIFANDRSAPSPALVRFASLPVRQFLTSGDAGQRVSDDGTFQKLFLRALRGEEYADANRDGYLTGTELGLFMSDRLTNLTRSRQTPRFGKLRDADFDRGEFVFALRPTLPGEPAAISDLRPESADDWPEVDPLVVESVQDDLINLGYNPGPSDGVWGPQTAAAIRAFQRDAGVPMDGRITATLVNALRRSVERDLATTRLEAEPPLLADPAPRVDPTPAFDPRPHRSPARSKRPVAYDPERPYCREYQRTVRIGGRERLSYGRACLQPDGTWKIVQ